MIPNQKNDTIKFSTDKFRCKIHDVVFKTIKESYVSDPKCQSIICAGGRAAGKSHNIIDNMVFWLPETFGDVGVIITYSVEHKATTALLVTQKLLDHGYTINQTRVNTSDIIYNFGNNNYIYIRSMQTSSIVQLSEKMKNFELLPGTRIKFIVFEEFTAILNLFSDDLNNFYNTLSGFNRHMNKRSITIYIYNPPKNKTHVIVKWYKDNLKTMINHYSTIFDLPERFQSEQDLKNAEHLKIIDKESYDHIYLGLQTGTDGLAYNVTSDIWTDSLGYTSYYVQTDEATTNATVFAIYGISTCGKLVLVSIYYHASRITGQTKAPSQYATEFVEFLNHNEIDYGVEICTDGLIFKEELKKIGFKNVVSIGKLKDRKLSYQLSKKIIDEGDFKVERKSENQIFVNQITSALKESTSSGVVVSKKGESGNDENKHFHAGDTLLYMCLRLQRTILKGRE